MGPYPWFDSTMVVPLLIRGEVRGFYDIELRASGRLTRGIIDLLVRIGKPLAAVLWDADTYSYNEHRTDKVVSQFINSTASFSFDEVLLRRIDDQDLSRGRSTLSSATLSPGSHITLTPSESVRVRISQKGGRVTLSMRFNGKSGTPTSVSQILPDLSRTL